MYFLTDADGEVVYIGQSQNVRERMRQHEHNPRIQALDWTAVSWFQPGIPNHHWRLAAETCLVALLVPRGNQAILLKITKSNTLAEIRWQKRSRKS